MANLSPQWVLWGKYSNNEMAVIVDVKSSEKGPIFCRWSTLSGYKRSIVVSGFICLRYNLRPFVARPLVIAGNTT